MYMQQVESISVFHKQKQWHRSLITNLQKVAENNIQGLNLPKSGQGENIFHPLCEILPHKGSGRYLPIHKRYDIITIRAYYNLGQNQLQQNLKNGSLRVRAVFHKTVRLCHVYCNFKIGFTCRIAVIFGTLKDESLLINTLASNICFSYRNMFQNGIDALSKIVDAFLSKSSKCYLVWIIQ